MSDESVDEGHATRDRVARAAYATWIQAALVLRFATDPVARIAAIEALREEIPGSAPGGSVTVTAALARLRVRTMDTR